MSQIHGILAYSSYVPSYRLSGEELSGALGAGSSKGGRPVACYDEDTTTMAVEAASLLVDSDGTPPPALLLATTAPAYADKTNATAVAAALDLGHDGFAGDITGSARGATTALRAAQNAPGLAVLSDMRTGRPGSADERGGADAAAAVLFGPAEESVAEVIAAASTSAEFLDRWRAPGAIASDVWEERFGQEAYMPLIERAIALALARAGIDAPDHLVVSSPHSRVALAVRRAHGADMPELPSYGYAGAADAALGLGAALDVATEGETILVLNAVDGCDATVLRSRAEPGAGRRGDRLASQLEGGREVNYTTYLTWRGLIERELPRRPEPDRPAGPPSARSESWKFGFVGSACTECGRVHVPPKRVCSNCGAIDKMERRRMADAEGTVATFTVDRLAHSPSPPMIDAVIDFDGGGRYTLEVTDAKPDQIAIGSRVEMAFRRLYTSGGVHNYFWKAKPADAGAANPDG
jgi:hydroxymethylglutaryl-CoA synthase